MEAPAHERRAALERLIIPAEPRPAVPEHRARAALAALEGGNPSLFAPEGQFAPARRLWSEIKARGYRADEQTAGRFLAVLEHVGYDAPYQAQRARLVAEFPGPGAEPPKSKRTATLEPAAQRTPRAVAPTSEGERLQAPPAAEPLRVTPEPPATPIAPPAQAQERPGPVPAALSVPKVPSTGYESTARYPLLERYVTGDPVPEAGLTERQALALDTFLADPGGTLPKWARKVGASAQAFHKLSNKALEKLGVGKTLAELQEQMKQEAQGELRARREGVRVGGKRPVEGQEADVRPEARPSEMREQDVARLEPGQRGAVDEADAFLRANLTEQQRRDAGILYGQERPMPGAPEPELNVPATYPRFWVHTGERFEPSEGGGFEHRTKAFGGMKLRVAERRYKSSMSGKDTVVVRLEDADGEGRASASFEFDPPTGRWEVRLVTVEEGMRREGIARKMYNYFTERHGTVERSTKQFDEGKKFWDGAQRLRPGETFAEQLLRARASATAEPGVLYSAGRGMPGARAAPPESPLGPFDIAAQQKQIWQGGPEYVEPAVPGDRRMAGAALTKERASVIARRAAGPALTRLEEQVHLRLLKEKLELNPVLLGPEVAAGLKSFDYDPARPMGKVAMMEGATDYVLRKVSGELDPSTFTPQQKAAARFVESFLASKGLSETVARTQALYDNWKAQTPVQQAAGLVSATGRAPGPVLTPGERIRSVWQRVKEWWEDAVTNELGPLVRSGMRKAEVLYNNLLRADKGRANQWLREGAGTVRNGRYEVIGLSEEKIVAGLSERVVRPVAQSRPGWWGKMESLFEDGTRVSEGGLFAIARHVTNENARGQAALPLAEAQLLQARRDLRSAPKDQRKAMREQVRSARRAVDEARAQIDVVPADQLRLYQEALREMSKDPQFLKEATVFADRLTRANNSLVLALASPDVHRISEQQAAAWIAKRPDYVPLTRVREDALFPGRAAGARGEQIGSPASFKRRTGGSGEQVVDPLVSYVERVQQFARQFNEQLRRNAVADYLRQPGMAEWGIEAPLKEGEIPDSPYAERVPFKREGLATWYWYGPGGRLTNFRIKDRALYDLITGQSGDHNVVKTFFETMAKLPGIRHLADVQRRLATGFSIGFQARNIPRDVHTFFGNTIDRASAGDLPGAYKRAFQFEYDILRGHVPKDEVFHLFARERGREQRMFSWTEETSDIPTAHGNAHVLGNLWAKTQQVVNTVGAGELAPRFREFLNSLKKQGWTEQRLLEEMRRAEAAVRKGETYKDPIPWDVLQEAMFAANEVTVPFSRQGYVTRAINGLVPFFGPAVSGTAKYIRNWRENGRGAAIALGALMAARLMHWAAVSDEDWYRELSPYDRFNNFVVQDPVTGQRWRLPSQRGIDVPLTGAFTTMLDAAAARNPDFRGLVRESVKAVAPPHSTVAGIPVPLPPALSVPTDIQGNTDQFGKPIVPQRDADLSPWSKFQEYYGPYAMRQFTGSRVNLKARSLLDAFGQASGLGGFKVGSERRGVDEFYEELDDARAEALKFKRKGLAYEGASRLKRLEKAADDMADLNRRLRGERKVGQRVVPGTEPTADQRDAIRKRQTDVARRALEAARD
jgi:hypothetical protein